MFAVVLNGTSKVVNQTFLADPVYISPWHHVDAYILSPEDVQHERFPLNEQKAQTAIEREKLRYRLKREIWSQQPNTALFVMFWGSGEFENVTDDTVTLYNSKTGVVMVVGLTRPE